MFIKENIFKQISILIASISLLVLVILAADETGRGDIRTLTALAETNSGVMEALEESSAEIKEIEEEAAKRQFQNSQSQERYEVQTQAEKQAKQNSLKEKLMLNEKIVEENKKAEEEEENKKTAADQKTADAVVPCSQEDYQILLRIVQAEAGICDETGKVLVANVILNRVRDEEFPDTIKEVVYQKSQFSPVSNGTINTCKVTQQTVDCVNRALMGEDYSQGALYFMNRGGARSGAADWFDGRLTFLFQHEKHEFFK